MGDSDMGEAGGGAGTDDPALRLPGRRVRAGAGWSWVRRGWTLFTRAPLMWVISMVLLFLVTLAFNVVPVVGSIAFQLIQAVITGGFVAACRSLEQGGDFELEHLLAGFQQRFMSLFWVGAITLAGWALIALVFTLFAGFAIFEAFMAGDAEQVMERLAASSVSLLLGGLVAAALMVPLMAAYWFAPALVMMHDMKPVAAMKASLSAALRNVLPFLVYGLVMMIAAVIAAIPFMLGFLAWIPLAIASTYVAYRDIFTQDAPEPAARAQV